MTSPYGSMKKVSKLIARHDIAIRVNEEGIKAHVARQQTLLAVDVVDQAVIKVCTEPLLRAVTTEQFVDQIFKVLCDHRTVVDDVLGLNEVEAVVQRSSCELHAHLVGDLVQWNQVRSVLVLNGHAEANVLHAHLTQFLQRAITTLVAVLQTTDLVVGLLQALDRDTNTDLRDLLAQVYDTIGKETVRGNNDTVGLLTQFLQRSITTLITVLQTTDFVVGLLQTLDRDTNTDLWELLAQVNDTIGEEAVRGNNDTVRLLVQFTHDILQVGTDERLAAGDVGEVHLRQFLDGFDADLLFRLGRCFITVAHRATSIATISDDDRTSGLEGAL